jgi:hypothetical protein
MNFDIDFSSGPIQAYHRYLEQLLSESRAKNDGLSLSAEETHQLRGRIALLKELLALPTMKKTMEAQARFGHPEE